MPASPACTASSGASAAASRRRVRVVQAHVAHAVRARLLDDPGGAAPRRQPDEAQARHRRQHLERLAADRAGASRG